jgi:hypothetical protein
MQDLFKPSIRLKEDISVPALEISPGEDSPVPTSRTLPGKDKPAPTFKVNSGASVGPMKLNQEPRGEIAAIVGPPNPNKDWRKPISKYLCLRTIPDDEIETRCLTRGAKGYLIHNDKLYHRSTLGVLQRCIPLEEGKALLLDVHEGGLWASRFVKKHGPEGFPTSILLADSC